MLVGMTMRGLDDYGDGVDSHFSNSYSLIDPKVRGEK